MVFLRSFLVVYSCSVILLSAVIVQCFQSYGRSRRSWSHQERRCRLKANTAATNYAGLLASFDAKTGALLPVPEKFVPKAFVEWGMIPTTLEVLSSTTSSSRMQTIVLPETGCGVDNLETITTVEEHVRIADTDATTISFPQSKNKRAYEVVFPYNMLDIEGSSNDDEGSYRFRVRIMVTSSPSPTYGPIEVVVERCVASPSRSIADTRGGGLDAQSVSRWLGGKLSSKRWRAFGETNVASQKETGRLHLPLDLVVTIAEDGILEVSKQGSSTVRFPLTGDDSFTS